MVNNFLLLSGLCLILSACDPASGPSGNDPDLIRINWAGDLAYAALMSDDSLIAVSKLDSVFKIGKNGGFRKYKGILSLDNVSFASDGNSVVLLNKGGSLVRYDLTLTKYQKELGGIIQGNWRLYHDRKNQKLLALVQQVYQTDFSFTSATPAKGATITNPDIKGKEQYLGAGYGTASEYLLIQIPVSGGQEYYIGKGSFQNQFADFTRLPSKVSLGAPVIEGTKYLIVNNMVISGLVVTQDILSSGESFLTGQIPGSDGALYVVTATASGTFVKKLVETTSSVSLTTRGSYPADSKKFLGFDGKTILYQDLATRQIVLDPL